MKQLAPVIRRATTLYQVTACAEELEGHLFNSLPRLFAWLDTIPDPKQVFVEMSLAFNVKTFDVRVIENPTAENHHYTLHENEVAGTVDLAVLSGSGRRQRLYVTDHKTGEGDFSRPDKLPQIKTLSLMLQRHLLPNGPHVTAGIFHAFRRGLAKMYTDDILASDLKQHGVSLREAMARIGDGSMRPGAQCDRCPARTGCPAGDSELLTRTETLLNKSNVFGSELLLTGNSNTGLSRNEQLGYLYEIIRNGEALAARARQMISAEMAMGALPILPTGKVLVSKTRNVERLSKREFVQAYGKLAAERMFDKWRRDGALTQKPEAYTWAADD